MKYNKLFTWVFRLLIILCVIFGAYVMFGLSRLQNQIERLNVTHTEINAIGDSVAYILNETGGEIDHTDINVKRILRYRNRLAGLQSIAMENHDAEGYNDATVILNAIDGIMINHKGVNTQLRNIIKNTERYMHLELSR